MKKSFALFTGLVLIAASLVFTGCENFFSGNNLKKELEEKIQYEQSKPITIYIADTAITCKVGDFVNLTYSVPDGYIFNKWVVLNSDGVETTGFIHIDDELTVRTTAKILEPAEAFTIKPVCSLIPKIVDYFPKEVVSGYPQDTNLLITFNKPVFLSDFYTEQEGLKNIHIYYDQQEITKTNFTEAIYYESLDNSGHKIYCLNVKTNEGNRILEPNSEVGVKELSVVLDTNNIRDAEKVAFENNFTWTYKINSTVDSTGPELKEVHIYKTKKQDGTYADELSMEELSSWTEETYRKNHISDTFYYTCKVTDDGGVDAVRVVENGIKLMSGADFTYHNYSTVTFKKISEDTYECEGEYHCSEDFNGLLNVEFEITDIAGNPIDKSVSFCLVKDSIINTPDIKIYNTLPSMKMSSNRKIEDLYTSETTLEEIQESICKIYFSANDVWLIKDGKTYSDYIDLKAVTLYTEGKQEEKISFENGKDSDDKDCYILNLAHEHFDSLSAIFIRLSLMDSIGNSMIKEYEIPSRGEILGVGRYDHDAQGYDSFIISVSETSLNAYDPLKHHVFVSRESFETNPYEPFACVTRDGVQLYIETETERYIPHYVKAQKYIRYVNANNEKFILYGTVGKEIVLLHEGGTVDDSVKIPDFTYDFENGTVNSGKVKLSVEYENGFNFDSEYTYFVSVYYYVSSYGGYFERVYRGLPGNIEIKWNSENDMYITSGVMDAYGNVKEKYEKIIPKNLLKDRTPPTCGASGIYKSKLIASAEDLRGSGLKTLDGFATLKYSLNGYYEDCKLLKAEDIKNMSDLKTLIAPCIDNISSEFSIPLYDVPDGNYYFAALIYDNEGNYGSDVYGYPIWIYKSSYDYDLAYNDSTGKIYTTMEAKKIPIDIDFGVTGYVHNLIENYYFLHWFDFYDETSGKWIESDINDYVSGEEMRLNENEWTNHIEGDIVKNEYPIGDEYKNKFAKVYSILIDFDTAEDLHMYMTPKYIYTGDTSVSIKKMDQISDNCYIAKSDNPYIVETFVSSIGYGDSIEDWVARAEPKNPKVLRDLDYYTVNNNDIPNGYYYTVIVHFPDGTSLMSEVKQKL